MSLQLKQQLLVQEIIDKGYNIDAFQKYIGQKHDLEEWDYDELQETVKQFQDQQNDYFQVLKCNQTLPNSISDITNIQSTVLGYEKVQKGIFLTTHIYFKIETKPINWIVKRTYEDFITLKNILNKYYTVPNIPNQRKSPIEFTYIKQLRHIQMFLNFILSQPEIKSLSIIQEFLSLEQFSQSINYSTLSGDYGLRINKQISDYIKQSDYYLNNITPLQKEAYKLIKQLMKQMSQQNVTYSKLVDVYKHLFCESKAQNNILKDCYFQIQLLFESLNKVQTENIKTINETIYPQQRFQYNQTIPLKDLLNQRNKIKNQYIDFAQKLKLKKEKLFQQGEVIKWDLDESYLDSFKLEQIKSTPQIAFQCMCKTDNTQLQNLKNLYGQINLRSYETIENVINYQSLQIKEYLQRFTKQISKTQGMLQNVFQETLNNLIDQ